MGKEGIEPSRLAARDPKSRLSASSSTSPCPGIISGARGAVKATAYASRQGAAELAQMDQIMVGCQADEFGQRRGAKQRMTSWQVPCLVIQARRGGQLSPCGRRQIGTGPAEDPGRCNAAGPAHWSGSAAERKGLGCSKICSIRAWLISSSTSRKWQTISTGDHSDVDGFSCQVPVGNPSIIPSSAAR